MTTTIPRFVAFETGKINVSFPVVGTILYRLDPQTGAQTVVQTATDRPLTALLDVFAGCEYFSNGGPVDVSPVGDNQAPVIPLLAAGREFLYAIAGVPTRVSLYNPGLEALTVSHYIGGTGVGGSAVGSVTIAPKTVQTYAYAPADVSLPRRDFFRVTSGAGSVVLARRKETLYDFETVYPAAPVNYVVFDLGTSPLLVDVHNRGTPTVTKNAHCLFSADLLTPCAAYTDGAAGGGISSKPSALLRNSYVIGHALRNYQIVARNPNTSVLIRYLDVNARVWRTHATRTLNPGSIYTPAVYSESEGVPGAGLRSGSALWLFTSSQPFLLRSSFLGKYYYPTGWNAEDLAAPFSTKIGKYFPPPVAPDAFYDKISPNDGFAYGNLEFAHSGLYKAWGYSQGANVVLGMIDGGIDLTHREFVGRIATNAGEIVGNKIDDDGNGYVDDVYGARTFQKRNDGVLTDTTGHGTQVASIMVGNGNRATPIDPVHGEYTFYSGCPKATLIPVKFSDNGGQDINSMIDSIRYLYSRGVRIISFQTGTPASYASSIASLLNARPDLLLLVGAGNYNSEITDAEPFYPATIARSVANIISVGAAGYRRQYDSNGRRFFEYTRAPYSNFANAAHRSVTLFAPGTFMLAKKGGTYGFGSGTSFAAPYTASVAAMMKSYYPDITVAQIKHLLIEGCSPMSDGALYSVAGGGVNAGKSMALLRTKLVHDIPLTTNLPADIPVENWVNENVQDERLPSPAVFVYPS